MTEIEVYNYTLKTWIPARLESEDPERCKVFIRFYEDYKDFTSWYNPDHIRIRLKVGK